MKKVVFTALLIALFHCLVAQAAAFSLDEQRMQSHASGQGWRLVLPIEAPEARGAITASLSFHDPELIPFEEVIYTKTLRSGERQGYEAVFSMKLKPTAYQGLYPATLEVTGKDAQGQPVTGSLALSVPFTGGEVEPLQEPLRVLSLSVGKQALTPGGTGALQVTLGNASHRTPLEQLALTIMDPAGAILPRASHTLLVPTLAPGEKRTLSYPVQLQPDSLPRLHVAMVAVAYTRFPKTPGAISRGFTLPVTQDLRLHHGRPELPLQVTQGDLVSFNLPLMNMGKGSIHNTLLTFSIPGISQGDSVLAGNILPGATAQGKATFQVSDQRLGLVKGQVVITYEDAQGREEQFTLPLQTEILARKPAENAIGASEPSAEQPSEPSLLARWWPVGAVLLLLVLLAVQGLYYRGRLRRLEEAKL